MKGCIKNKEIFYLIWHNSCLNCIIEILPTKYGFNKNANFISISSPMYKTAKNMLAIYSFM